MNATTVNTSDAVFITGATARQLDYWARTGMLVPVVPAAGSGSRRRYSKADCKIGARLAALSALAPPQQGIDKTTAVALAHNETVTVGSTSVSSTSGAITVSVDFSIADDHFRRRWDQVAGEGRER